MKYLVWGLVVLLIILHQDLWFWEDGMLVAGVLPIGLFYHICLSLAAGATWYLATHFAWPLDQDESAEGRVTSPSVGSTAAGRQPDNRPDREGAV